jgi:methylated-DNA-[protein]-cysteine S-methyltransferase
VAGAGIHRRAERCTDTQANPSRQTNRAAQGVDARPPPRDCQGIIMMNHTASTALPARRTTGLGLSQGVIDTPLGPLTALACDAGLMGLWFDTQRHSPGALDAPVDDAQPWIAQARKELALYFAGRLREFKVPLAPQGTSFQEAVWRYLCEIRCGDTVSYGRIARELGSPQASRAVGAAVGRNPISVLVPCHRVIGENGTLTGYAGGLHRKQALLDIEGTVLAPGARHEAQPTLL